MALKTQQAALFHSTNVSIVGVRQMEVDYLTSVYGSMGVQCAFLGSLAMACMSQTPGMARLLVYLYGSAWSR
jgi:hypothetical protein